MMSGALVTGVLGIAATFFPHEMLQRLGHPGDAVLPLLIQLLGAMYIAFAILDWITRHSLIGGIYNRPIALANLVHFTSGALALAKGMFATSQAAILWPLTIVYSVLAAAFAAVLFTSPVKPVESP